MIYRLSADFLVLVHLLFIMFVILGGLLTLKKKWFFYLHIPAVIWAALIEFKGWICPLTPWENQLRQAGGEAGYTGGFIEHYIIPIIYHDKLTVELQIIFGVAVIAINIVIYSLVFNHFFKSKKTETK